jgi:hypothetical protein
MCLSVLLKKYGCCCISNMSVSARSDLHILTSLVSPRTVKKSSVCQVLLAHSSSMILKWYRSKIYIDVNHFLRELNRMYGQQQEPLIFLTWDVSLFFIRYSIYYYIILEKFIWGTWKVFLLYEKCLMYESEL